MKTKIGNLLLALLALFTGCATTQERDPVQIAVTGIATVALRNNPRYQPLVQAIVDRIDVVLARGFTSPQHLEEFLAQLQITYALDSDSLRDIRETILKVRAAFYLINGYEFPLEFAIDEKAAAFLRKTKISIAQASGLALVFPK